MAIRIPPESGPDIYYFECRHPIPISVNGGQYAGCELPPGHEGDHRVTVWSAS